ncbi:MAG: helix-turn-helix domain-containing protein, partial [Nocardioidaceae bacterium]
MAASRATRGSRTSRATRAGATTQGDGAQPLTPAGERLVEAASELFYRRGIRAVGVDLIAEVAGTTKKTLYDRFGSKDGLVVLYLQRRQHRW